ncbi:fibrobacter succinogenes major paralogous domain-containing protein [Aquiflexum sp.]|uniref:fibrobacter succinogenes major paralogous domain-containing protein n=1 Tax=Aquiflexum sp. TaxID=1872584 RepID=UPI0035945DD4
MKIRKLLFLFFSLLSFLLFSCKEEEIPLQILTPVPGGDWVIYQLAKIHVPEIPVADNSFSGSIGDVPISLGRIAGDTLIFIIPNVGEGPAALKVTMGNQVRTWNLRLSTWPNFQDQEIFIESFLTSTRTLQNKIQEIDELKELANPFGTWIGFFIQKQQSLSELEKETLAGVFQYGRNHLFFSNRHETFELPCHNSPESTMASMTWAFGSFDNSYLRDFSKLPKTAFHDAVVAGLGLSFWYQKILLEYYAYQTLLCPVIQEIQLIESASGKVIQPNDTLIIEPLVPISFETLGIFRRITKTDLEQGEDTLFTPTYGFNGKSLISKDFSDWIQLYIEDYKWELPILDEKSWVSAPDEAPFTTGPVHGQSWYLPTIDNPDVRLANYKDLEGNLMLIFENNLVDPLPFNMKLTLFATAFNTEFVVPAILETGCPLSADLLLIDRTHFLEIESGIPPYQVTWSNGVNGVLSQTLSPGNYDVKVTDTNGCERTVQFTSPEFGTVEDIDGNTYETVKIGNTWWMADNLRTTRMRDGTAIQSIESDAVWVSATGPSYSWKDNDSDLDESYGKLYNYHAACCEICPEGWKLPGIFEISSFGSIFGLNVGRYIKAVAGWPIGSLKSNNLSGLRFLPSGFRSGTDGGFGPSSGEFSTFWTSYRDQRGYPHLGFLQGSVDYLSTGISVNPRDGFSVRCVKE